MYETKRNSTRTPTASGAGSLATRRKLRYPPGCPNGRRCSRFGCAMAGCLREEGLKGFGKQAASWPNTQTIGKTSQKADSSTTERPTCPRIQYPSVDPEACSRVNIQLLRCSLRSFRGLAHSECPRLELSKARTACQRMQRSSNRCFIHSSSVQNLNYDSFL